MVLFFSCKSKEASTGEKSSVLVSVGDSSLTMEAVLREIPSGLDPADSVRMFHRIVDSWVRELVLLDQARRNITDMERIDRLVEAYRNSLIVNQYIESMGEQGAADVDEDRIRKYYEQYRDRMTLEQPLVKGAFLKVAKSDPQLDDLRHWMSEFSDEAVDKIEKSGLRQASRYEYFRDEWHEFGVIAEQIPYRFTDADAFVKAHRNFETEESGSVYLLHISEYLPTGSEMPYDFAKLKIAEILRSENVNAYTDKLISDIYRQSVKEGILKPGLYDPQTKELKEK